MSRRELLKKTRQIGAGALAARTFAVVNGRATSQSAGPPIEIGGTPVELTVTVTSPATLRITLAGLDRGEPRTIPNDGSLVERTWPDPVVRLRTLEGQRTLNAGSFTVRLTPAGATPALGIDVAARDGRLVQRLRIDQRSGAMRFLVGDEPLVGLGEGGPQFDRRGSTDRMRSGQGGYQLRTHGGRVPIQWLIGTGGWGLLIHEPYGTFDFTGDLTGVGALFTPSEDAPLPLDLFVIGSIGSAADPATIMDEYAKLTGYPEMPPLWSLGYLQSHRTLAGPDEILQEAKTFRAKRLPCDGLIYLGTGFCPSGWNTDNGEFAFNRNVLPDPPAIMRALHADHFKVVLHVVLEGRTLAGTVADRCTAPPLPSGRTADGKWPDDRQVSCYWPVHKRLFDAGVDGFWPDQGDGFDRHSRLARIRMYWDGSRQLRPIQRPFALHRNGHAGMQRYAAFLWSGDVYSTWETLRTHVPVAINTALSGVPFWGTDIGGFVPTKELTGELYVRWFQFGAFCPLFRSHGRTWKLRLPWGWNTGELGPDEVTTTAGGAANPDPSELHNARVEPICRAFLELRYRLLPYLYSAVRQAHQTGLPIVRALWLHYPQDRIAASRGDQYLWGRDILVAPVVEKGATARTVYLPAGRWYDFWTEEPLEGRREISRPVDLSVMPLFVRAGAIVPLGPVRQHTGEVVDDPLTLQIYPGVDGQLALYEDDGTTFEYQRGNWMGIEGQWDDGARRLTLRLAAGSRMRDPARRPIIVRLAGSSDTRDVVFAGSPLEIRL
jgi:alpha-glucosidase/alpha-D-xyloside xylohydrolase